MEHKYPNQRSYGNNKSGSYVQIVNANQTTISQGDKIKISHFISGYGLIDINTAKIYYSASAEIVDASYSFNRSGYKEISKSDVDSYLGEWGGKPNQFDNGATLILNGVIQPINLETNENLGGVITMFDDSQSTGIIMLEETTGRDLKKQNPPIEWNIKIKDNVKPGQYYLTFILTYYNGENWQNDKVELPIKVMNWHEKYDVPVKWSAIILAFLTLITLFFSIQKDFSGLITKKKNPVSDSIIRLNKTIEELNSTNKNLISRMDSLNKKDTNYVKKEVKKTLKKKK